MSDDAKTAAEIGSLGGKATAAKMSRAERSERAAQAATARWSATLPRATHGDSDHPLRIGNIEIPCYVLEGGRRVITQRGFQAALGMNASGGARRLLNFVGTLAANGIDTKDLESRVSEPIKFVATEGGNVGVTAHGYEASALADMCDVILDARKAGLLRKAQEHYADYCEILLRSFARVGLVALIDEATGYQYDRPRRELEELLKTFVSESLRRWVRTFPADYFKELCRLRGIELRQDMRLPQYFGHLTNDLVYRRIAPGLLRRLKERRSERGKPSNKLHSWLSDDKGIPEVLLHLGTVVGLMKIHDDYDTFVKQLNKIAPVYPEKPGLFDDPKDWE
jgi:hypothetical protein